MGEPAPTLPDPPPFHKPFSGTLYPSHNPLRSGRLVQMFHVEHPALISRSGLFADTEPGEDQVQYVIRGGFAGHLTDGMKRLP